MLIKICKLVTEMKVLPLGQYRGPGDDRWRGCMLHVDALDAIVKIKQCTNIKTMHFRNTVRNTNTYITPVPVIICPLPLQ
jgi:hypothetical protein